MKPKRKHAKLIKAWEDGAEIEMYMPWHDMWVATSKPHWDWDCTFRIKPIPQPPEQCCCMKRMQITEDGKIRPVFQPLTTDQISTLFNMHQQDLNFPRLVADVRVVEAAHGIGEE
jgi:hypothetical protein